MPSQQWRHRAAGAPDLDPDPAGHPVRIHGDDYLDGGNGRDDLYGHDGNDYLTGGNSNVTAQARLGSQVTVVEMLDRLAPGLDSEVAKQLQRVLTKQGMTFRLGYYDAEAGWGQGPRAAVAVSSDGSSSDSSSRPTTSAKITVTSW